MRPLRYSINVALDGGGDHRAMLADEDVHRHAVDNLDRCWTRIGPKVWSGQNMAKFEPAL